MLLDSLLGNMKSLLTYHKRIKDNMFGIYLLQG